MARGKFVYAVNYTISYEDESDQYWILCRTLDDVKSRVENHFNIHNIIIVPTRYESTSDHRARVYIAEGSFGDVVCASKQRVQELTRLDPHCSTTILHTSLLS